MAEPVMTLREWALLLVLSILWGASFLFIRIAVHDIGPLQLVFLRLAGAAIVMVPLVYLKGLRMPTSARLWGDYIVMGLLNNVIAFSLLFWGERYVSAGLASVLGGLTPLFSVLLMRASSAREPITPHRFLGLLLGIAGVVVLVGLEALGAPGDAGFTMLLAQGAIIAMAASYALAGVYGRRFKGQPPLVTATGQITAATLIMLPLMLVFDPVTDIAAWTTPTALVSVAWLSLLSTAFAYILYFRLLASAGPTNITLVTLLCPATAVLLGWLVLDEVLLFRHIAGMALIAAGLLAIDGRIFRRRRVSGSPSAE